MADVSLKEHLELALREQDRRIEQAQNAARAAIEKAELAVEKRLELLNEFRGMEADRSAKYARRDEVDRLIERIEFLESLRDRMYGGIMIMSLVIAAAFALVKLFFG